MTKDFLERLEEVYYAGEGVTYSYPVKSAEIVGDVLHIVAIIHRKEKHLYGHKDSVYAIGAHDNVYYLLENEAKWRAKREAIVESVKKCNESLLNLQNLLS